jgi:ferrous iron transport protein A
MPTLNELAPGTTARVLQLNGPPALVQRLAELGLFEGETLEVVALAPLGDPMEIHLGNTRLTLRKQEASSVLVEVLPSAEPS